MKNKKAPYLGGNYSQLKNREMEKKLFANTMTEKDLGVMASSVMTDCEKYGMTWGCDIDCPVLQMGECELKDTENKDLYNDFLDSLDEE